MDVNVIRKIRCTSHKIKKTIDNSEVMRTTPELTTMTGWTLGFLYHQQNEGNVVFQKDIEKEFNINRSTASELLTAMEANGYIQRVTIEEDKRCRKIVLTDKAVELQKQVTQTIRGVEEQALTGFSQEEINQLDEFLNRIYQNLDRKDDKQC